MPFNSAALKFDVRQLKFVTFMVTLAAFGCVMLTAIRFVRAVTDTGSLAMDDASNSVSSNIPIAPIPFALEHIDWFGLSPDDLAGNYSSAGNVASLFVLKGISDSPNALFAGAFIAEKGQAEIYYHLGDTLPENAGTLAGVFSDHVTIRHGETIETLGFLNAPNQNIEKPSADTGTTVSSPIPAFIYMPPDKKASAAVPSIAEITKNFISDPEGTLKQVGLQPVASGKDQGYRFTGEDSQGVFEGAGLQKNDVIKSVDGSAVGNSKSDQLLIPKLAMAKSVQLDVQRGDTNVTIEYKLP